MEVYIFAVYILVSMDQHNQQHPDIVEKVVLACKYHCNLCIKSKRPRLCRVQDSK